MLIKLMQGVMEFKSNSFIHMQSMFEELKKGQHPETLFITCSDSRVVPNLFTNQNPGQLLFVRNPGNIIPPYDPLSASSEAAAITFAFEKFDIKDIIICGHSQCGAMNGLLHMEDTPSAVSRWIEHAKPVLDDLCEHLDVDEKLTQVIQKNIVLQIEHLKTYPMIAEKLASNALTIHGWLYEFETGSVFIHESDANKFVLLEESDSLRRAIDERRNKIVKQAAINYLSGLSPDVYNQIMPLLMNDIQPIWDHIKDAVSKDLWIELGSVYKDPTDEKFVELVESGSQLKITGLHRSEEQCAMQQMGFFAGKSFVERDGSTEKMLSHHQGNCC